MGNTPTSNHTDASPPENAPEDGKYRTPMEHAPFPQKDGYDPGERKYGAVEKRGFDIHVSSPVDDVEELSRRTHLAAQFHVNNRPYWEENSRFINDGGMLYDRAVLDLFEEKLNCEGINLSDPDIEIPLPRLKALFLRKAREQSGTDFHEYLTDTQAAGLPTLQKTGYETRSEVPSYQTFQRTYNTLHGEDTDTIDGDAFEAAVTRAVYAVYRAGIVPPDAVKQEYGFDALEPPLNEKYVSRDTEKAELREFVELLFDLTTEPLTFGRDSEQSKHDMQAFIGALAASALTGAGLEGLKDVCDWNHPRDRIPGGAWLDNYVSGLPIHAEEMSESQFDGAADSISTIDEQFNAVHRLTLQFAKALGFWSKSDPFKVGIDMFRVDWAGESLDVTIGRPPKADNDAVTEQWTFVIAGGAEPENRFILGGRWLQTLRDYPTAVREILSNAVPPAAIDTVLIDSEIVSGELIDTLWEFVGEDWIISAPDSVVVTGLKRLTPANHVGYAPEIRWNTDSKPNLVTYPTEGNNPDPVLVDPRDIALEAIQEEGDDDKIAIPLKHRLEDDTPRPTSLEPDPDVPLLIDAVDDLEAAPGIGSEDGLAAYFTGRSLQNRSGSGIRFQYVQRWSIEKTVDQLKNDFMPTINSRDPKKRLYAMHVAILLYNWHTLINRCLSPNGIRLDITHQELLQAIQHVAFNDSSSEE